MILSIKEQADVFLFVFLSGTAAGIFYDVIRIIRINIKHNDFMVNVEDIAYWLIVTIIAFLLMLNKNKADIRFFTIIGFYIGMLTYNLMFSCTFIRIMAFMVRILRRVLKAVFQIIFTPVRLIGMAVEKPVKRTIGITECYLKKVLHLTRVYAKINKRKIADQMRFIRHRKE